MAIVKRLLTVLFAPLFPPLRHEIWPKSKPPRNASSIVAQPVLALLGSPAESFICMFWNATEAKVA